MKKRYSFAVLITILITFLIFRHQQTSSSPGLQDKTEKKTETLPEPEKKPLEIEGILQEYDQWLTEAIRESGTVGASVAIVYKDQVAFLKNFGVRKAGENDSVNAHTLYRLASVSKTITGVLAGILEEEGTLHLNDKVVDYLPEFRLKNPKSTHDLTIGNLLSHTSGLVPHAYDNMIEDKVPVSKIIQRLDEVDISAEPGQLYSYQNVMFSLLDTILSVKTGQKYGDLVKKKVFLPFGMKDASTDFQSFKQSRNAAYPHARGKGRYWPQRLNDRYYSTGPAAGVNASISDMASFLQALLKKDSPYLNNHVHQAVFTPRVPSHLPRRYLSHWERVESKHYAIGWRIVGYKGRKVAYHGGYVQGYKAEIALCRNEQAGIIYLTNSPNKVASQTVPRFLDLLFDFKDTRRILTQSEDSGQPANS